MYSYQLLHNFMQTYHLRTRTSNNKIDGLIKNIICKKIYPTFHFSQRLYEHGVSYYNLKKKLGTFNNSPSSVGGGKPSLKSSSPSFINVHFLPCKNLDVSLGSLDFTYFV